MYEIYAMEQNCDQVKFDDDNVCVNQILLMISDGFSPIPHSSKSSVGYCRIGKLHREKKDQEREGRIIRCQPVKFSGPPGVLLPITDHKDEILRQHKGNPGNIKKMSNKDYII
jgi:hypothetical protein